MSNLISVSLYLKVACFTLLLKKIFKTVQNIFIFLKHTILVVIISITVIIITIIIS